jgi:hypothetical protein
MTNALPSSFLFTTKYVHIKSTTVYALVGVGTLPAPFSPASVPEKSSFVEKMENLPGESNKVPINADVCKLNGKSAKNIARKSGKHKRSKNPPNWILKGSVVFIRSQREVTSYIAYYSLSSLKKEDGETV